MRDLRNLRCASSASCRAGVGRRTLGRLRGCGSPPLRREVAKLQGRSLQGSRSGEHPHSPASPLALLPSGLGGAALDEHVGYPFERVEKAGRPRPSSRSWSVCSGDTSRPRCSAELAEWVVARRALATRPSSPSRAVEHGGQAIAVALAEPEPPTASPRVIDDPTGVASCSRTPRRACARAWRGRDGMLVIAATGDRCPSGTWSW